MSKYCERVETRATKTLKLVNNGDYDRCNNSSDADSFKDSLDIMRTRYDDITAQLGDSSCGNVIDAYLKGTKALDKDYDMCKMVGKNINMALEYARGEYYTNCDHDEDLKDVSRTDYAETKTVNKDLPFLQKSYKNTYFNQGDKRPDMIPVTDKTIPSSTNKTIPKKAPAANKDLSFLQTSYDNKYYNQGDQKPAMIPRNK